MTMDPADTATLISLMVSVGILSYTLIKVKNILLSPFKLGNVLDLKQSTNYIARVRELEYTRDLLRDLIIKVYKEYESGALSKEDRDFLVNKFKSRLMEIEDELKSISKYAELERLEREYKKLDEDYHRKRFELEKKINELRSMLGVKESKKPGIIHTTSKTETTKVNIAESSKGSKSDKVEKVKTSRKTSEAKVKARKTKKHSSEVHKEDELSKIMKEVAEIIRELEE